MTKLNLNQPAANTVAQMTWQYYSFYVNDLHALTVQINETRSGGDADLFIKFGALPNHTSFDYRDISTVRTAPSLDSKPNHCSSDPTDVAGLVGQAGGAARQCPHHHVPRHLRIRVDFLQPPRHSGEYVASFAFPIIHRVDDWLFDLCIYCGPDMDGVRAGSCPSQCSRHGQCSGTTCRCSSQFSGRLCETSTPPSPQALIGPHVAVV